MSFPNIEQNLVQEYSAAVQMLVQQKESKLIPFVMKEVSNGERFYKEQYGVHAAPTEVTTRLKDYDLLDVETERRAVDLQRFVDTRGVDNFDEVRMLSDMTSSITMAQAAQLGRKIDNQILRAARGDALTGKTGSTIVSLPSSQKIAIDSHQYDSGTGNVGMTVSKMQEIQEVFDDAQVDLADRFVVMDPFNYQTLISDERASSSDYIGEERVLFDRRLKTYLQMNVIVLPRSQFETSASGIYNIAFSREGMLYVMGQQGLIQGDIFEDKKKESIGTYISKSQLTGAATRLQEPCVIEIDNLATSA